MVSRLLYSSFKYQLKIFFFIVENQKLLKDFETLKQLADSMSSYDNDQKKLESKLNSETNANLK